VGKYDLVLLGRGLNNKSIALVEDKKIRGPFLTSPMALRGEICPTGGMFTPSFTPKGEHSLKFRRMEGQTENFVPSG
jgi:hypothetical protein